MKRFIVLFVAAALLIGLQGASAAEMKVGIIQYVEHLALDSARQGFLAALADSGLEPGKNIIVDYQNAQGDAANLSTIGDRFLAKQVDLILAIATPAAQSVAAKTGTIPILGTAVTDYVSARLVFSNENPGTNVSGTSDLNPIEEQISLLKQLVPHAQTVGLLYTSSEDNSVLQAGIAKRAIAERGLKYYEITITNSNEVQQAVQSLVQKVDAIYVPTDNVVSASMPIVYGAAVQAQVPVICGEGNQVLNGGLATLGINYEKLGYQTGLMAVRVLRGEDVAAMPIETAGDFEYLINGTVAAELGILIPDELLEYATEIEME